MNLNLKLQKIILLLIIPALSLQILFQGWLVHYEKKKTIINGIDDILLTVSDTLGAFLHGSGHKELLTPKEMRSISASADPNYAWGIDDLSGDLVRLNLETGEATRIIFPNLPNLISLGFDQKHSKLYALDRDEITLYHIDLSNTEASEVGKFPTPTFGLFYHSEFEKLCSFNESLFSIETPLASSAQADLLSTRPLSPFKHASLVDVCFDPIEQRYLALTQNQQAVLFVSASSKHARALTVPQGSENENHFPMRTLLWDSNSQRLMAAGTLLGSIDLATGDYDTADNPLHFYSTEGPFYQAARPPMVRIKEELDLTYLYTQQLIGERQIIYGIDATDYDDENFTPPGFTDTISQEDNESFEKLVFHGSTHVTDVQYWKNWGYLKSCYAPIFNKDGNVIAMTGADVSADHVDRRTRMATYWSMFIGLNCILIAVLVSCLISLRLTQPIDAMKHNALLLAAGNYKKRIPAQSIRELDTLGNQMNSLANVLGSEIGNMQRFYERLSFHSISQYLSKLLHERASRPLIALSSEHAISEAEPELDSITVHGHLETVGKCFYWFFPPTKVVAHDAHYNLQIRNLVEAILKSNDDSWEALDNQMSAFAHELPDFNYLLIDTNTKTVQSHLKTGFSLYLKSNDGTAQPLDINAHVSLESDAHQLLFAEDGRPLDASILDSDEPKLDVPLLSFKLYPIHA